MLFVGSDPWCGSVRRLTVHCEVEDAAGKLG